MCNFNRYAQSVQRAMIIPRSFQCVEELKVGCVRTSLRQIIAVLVEREGTMLLERRCNVMSEIFSDVPLGMGTSLFHFQASGGY